MKIAEKYGEYLEHAVAKIHQISIVASLITLPLLMLMMCHGRAINLICISAQTSLAIAFGNALDSILCRDKLYTVLRDIVSLLGGPIPPYTEWCKIRHLYYEAFRESYGDKFGQIDLTAH
ncbi:MAG: hypothetical protein MHMPM18_003911 [Marteilia pararefringens]